MSELEKPVGHSLGWRMKTKSYLFRSQWYDVRQDQLAVSTVGERTYTYMEHPGSVFVVPFSPTGNIILIHSYRYTIDSWSWEIPAGGIGDHQGKTPMEVARCELEEEAGAVCGDLFSIGRFYLGNGHSHHLAHFFVARDAIIRKNKTLDDLELIDEISEVSVHDVKALLSRGGITDAESAFGILLALQLHSNAESS